MRRRDLLTLDLVERVALSKDTADEPAHSAWTQWEAFKNESNQSAGALFADPHERRRPSRIRWLGLSFAVQALMLCALMIPSFLADEELPPPRVVKTFMAMAATTPPPPPLRTVAATPPTTSGATAHAALPSFHLSTLRVDDIPVEWSKLADFGVDFADGVESGVPGGVVGGLVGGLAETAAPEPPTDAPTVYVVSGALDRPDKIVHIDPRYPRIATVARVEGLVILEATIDGEGNVEDLRVLRSVPLLDQAAVDAVRQWKYEPTIIAGNAVPIQMTVTVKFALA